MLLPYGKAMKDYAGVRFALGADAWSSFPNMKELRFRLDGLWRFAFAFDRNRHAIVLVGGNKVGKNQARFYRDLIRKADRRFAAHIASLRTATSQE